MKTSIKKTSYFIYSIFEANDLHAHPRLGKYTSMLILNF